MEYNFKLKDIFPENVSLLSNHLIPINCPQLRNLGKSAVKERVKNIVDDFGKASAHAQGLPSVVTSAEKLERGHEKLYIFCEFKKNCVVGFLKLGTKKLYLFDDAGVQHELKAPCILDFYIHESRQRKGYGKYLLDNVVRKEKILVTHFAVESPSEKMVYFLRKHYNMTHVLPQVHNFLLFEGFFDKRPDYLGGKVARWTGVNDLTNMPLDCFHFEKDNALQDSTEYIMEHAHRKSHGQFMLNLSERRHALRMHDNSHTICDKADRESVQCFAGDHTKMESRKTQCQH